MCPRWAMAARWSGCGSGLERTIFLFTTQLSLCAILSAVRQLVAAQVSLHCYGQLNSGRGRLYVNCWALNANSVKSWRKMTFIQKKTIKILKWTLTGVLISLIKQIEHCVFFLRIIIAVRKHGSVKASWPSLVEHSAKITNSALGQQQ